jgi:hypothetical protein
MAFRVWCTISLACVGVDPVDCSEGPVTWVTWETVNGSWFKLSPILSLPTAAGGDTLLIEEL